jgi:hypothetical protein
MGLYKLCEHKGRGRDRCESEKLPEDNHRRRRLAEDEERALLDVAAPFLRLACLDEAHAKRERSLAGTQGFEPARGEPQANGGVPELASRPRARPKAERSGWDAGIRTPITCSRGRCPTVERRPSRWRPRGERAS